MKNKKIMFWAIALIVMVCTVIIFVKPTKLGLDLVGGSRLVLEAQTTDTIAKITPDMIKTMTKDEVLGLINDDIYQYLDRKQKDAFMMRSLEIRVGR